jgi:hypothetical protein
LQSKLGRNDSGALNFRMFNRSLDIFQLGERYDRAHLSAWSKRIADYYFSGSLADRSAISSELSYDHQSVAAIG